MIEKFKKSKKEDYRDNVASCYECYNKDVKLLKDKIDKKGINNIGIIAPYGAGKSSLIKTLQKKYYNTIFNKNKLLTVSLANFENNNSEEQEIEKSILQQIVYNRKSNKLPESSINRIKIWNNGILFVMSLIIAMSIASIVILSLLLSQNLNFSFWEDILYFYRIEGTKLYPYVILTVSILCFILLIMDAFLLLRVVKINRIKVKDIEINLQNKEDSYLNKYIDEIIYFFYKSKVEVLVIEDIDRFDDVKIFSKLREINTIINSCNYIKQKVVFIYSIKDTIFREATDRAKFFDFIITLYPNLSYNECKDQIKDESKKILNKKILGDSFISIIAEYIKERRVLNNILNDVQYYYNNIICEEIKREFKEEDFEQLFALMVYKNVVPKDFADLQYNKGMLADVFKEKSKYINDKVTKLQEQIQVIQGEINFANSNKIHSMENLKRLVSAALSEKTYKSYNDCKSIIDNYQTFENVVNINYSGYNLIHIANLENILGFSIYKEERKICADIENLQKELIKKERELIEIYNLSTTELFDKYDMQVYSDIDYNNECENVDRILISTLIKNGYVKENYMSYISKTGYDFISENDQKFIRIINSKGKIAYNDKIDNALCVALNIPEERFNTKYILNYNLIKYLLEYTLLNQDKNYKFLKSKLEKLVKYLNTNEKEINDFIISYINIFGVNEILKCLTNKVNVFEIIYKEPSIPIERKKECLSFILNNYNLQSLCNLEKNTLSSALNDYNIEFVILPEEEQRNKYKDLFKHYNVKLPDLSKVLDSDVCQYCYEQELFAVNAVNLYHIRLKNLGNFSNIDYKMNSICSAIISNLIIKDNLNIEKRLIEYIEYCKNNYVFLILEQDTIKNILTRNIDIEYKKNIIELLGNKFDYFESINKELLLYAFQYNKIVSKWDNISCPLNRGEIALSNIKEYIQINIEELLNDNIDKNNMLSIINLDFDLPTIEKIVSSIDYKYQYNEIKKIMHKDYLILKKVVSFDYSGFIASSSNVNDFISFLSVYPDECSNYIDNVSSNIDLFDNVLENQNISDSIKIKIIKKSAYLPNTRESYINAVDIICRNKKEFDESIIIKYINKQDVGIEEQKRDLILLDMVSRDLLIAMLRSIDSAFEDRLANAETKKWQQLLEFLKTKKIITARKKPKSNIFIIKII